VIIVFSLATKDFSRAMTDRAVAVLAVAAIDFRAEKTELKRETVDFNLETKNFNRAGVLLPKVKPLNPGNRNPDRASYRICK
jgi:hypothetical protein